MWDLGIWLVAGIFLNDPVKSAPAPDSDPIARLAAQFMAADEPCSYVMERRRVCRLFESPEAAGADSLAAAIQSLATREAIIGSDHLSPWLQLANPIFVDSKTAPGWERAEDSFVVVHSPGATLQSSTRGGAPYHDLLTDSLTISSSWQNSQVDVHDGPIRLMRYSPSYLYAPMNVGAAPAKWFRTQKWAALSAAEPDCWLLEFADAEPAFELIRVGDRADRLTQVIVYYGPGDVVAAFFEYPKSPDSSLVPSRTVRVSCNKSYVEFLELRASVWKATPPDEAYLVPIPLQGALVDHRGGKRVIRKYGTTEAPWPDELLPFVVLRPDAVSESPPAKK